MKLMNRFEALFCSLLQVKSLQERIKKFVTFSCLRLSLYLFKDKEYLSL